MFFSNRLISIFLPPVTADFTSTKRLLSLPQKTQCIPQLLRFALRLSVWHFDFFHFPVLKPNHTGVFTLRAKERKVLQHRMGSDLCSRFAAASGTAEPIYVRACFFRHLRSPQFCAFLCQDGSVDTASVSELSSARKAASRSKVPAAKPGISLMDLQMLMLKPVKI